MQTLFATLAPTARVNTIAVLPGQKLGSSSEKRDRVASLTPANQKLGSGEAIEEAIKEAIKEEVIDERQGCNR